MVVSLHGLVIGRRGMTVSHSESVVGKITSCVVLHLFQDKNSFIIPKRKY